MRNRIIILLSIYSFIVLAGVLSSTMATQAKPTSRLTMAVHPLDCTIDIVHNGIRPAAYIGTHECQQVLKNEYTALQQTDL